MKKMLYMLAAAATLAACHNRGEDDMGAAPDRGDTTAVRTDSTTGGFDTTSTAQPSDTSMTPANPTPTDTTVAPTNPTPTDTTSAVPTTPTDTTSSAAPVPTTPDTSSMPNDSGMSADSSGTSGYSPSPGADSTNPTAGAPDSSMTLPPCATDSTQSNQ